MKHLVLALLILANALPAAEADAPTVRVKTQVTTEKSMPRFLRVTGQLKGSRDAMVAPNTNGKVVLAQAERGSVVKAGDVLLKLDDTSASLSLREAEASLATAQLKLDLARDELKRNEPLANSKAISDTDFSRLKNERASADANVAAATARRDIAKKAVDDAVIRASFAGTVAERLVDLGEFVQPSTQVVHLVALDPLHLWLNVPETSSGAIKEGQKVTFKVPAFPKEEFTGVVRYIGASVRESARDLVVEAVVPNADSKLKPGMFAEARIIIGEDVALTVPSSALRVEGSNRKVLVVLNGRVEERLVEVGETLGNTVEIRRGLNKGEAVVLNPAADAVDGVKVTLAN